tara:strand:- start:1376 stop:2935 length:1560 start_codon:yes stop_codon:yes gene_type:complete
MGIPSYFTHIIKNHSNIVSNKNDILIDNLYIDSNSIIYDVIHSIESDFSFSNIFKNVCIKLIYYINSIEPSKNVIIAFDGVAPIAKLEQQRTRRLRSLIINKINYNIDNNQKNKFDTTQITPGTDFMNKLNIYIKDYFNKIKLKCNIILSLTDTKGEGEHKIFQYIRDNIQKHSTENTVIYGLDADLIMLSLVHSKFCSNIFLYRETPHFIKQINSDLNPNELYIININLLANQIALDMNNFNSVDNDITNILINDYIFICFILGNDFMPHHPAINIRTNGIDILLDIYRKYFSYNNSIIQNNQIQWKQIKKLFEILSKSEDFFLINEHNKRNKLENRFFPNDNTENKLNKLNNLPSIQREKEKYIDPLSPFWESRYYETLFDISYHNDRIKQICINYLEALEWNYNYYTSNCINWRWSYKYHYCPLFKDIIQYIPNYNISIVSKDDRDFDSIFQLCYVLPQESHYLLSNKISNKMIIHYPELYNKNIQLEWAYCKYLWESHLTLPHIDINKIEKILLT